MGKFRRTKANGRSAGAQFVALPYPTLKSDAWRSLSGPAVKVLLELYTRFNGANNGTLALSYAEATSKLGLGRATVKRAFAEIEQKGFARLAKKGHWYGRKASEWVITNQAWDGNLPTNEWKHWRRARASKTELGSEMEHIDR